MPLLVLIAAVVLLRCPPALATAPENAAATPPEAAVPGSPAARSDEAAPLAPDGSIGADTSALPEAPFGLEWLLSREEVRQRVGDVGTPFATPFGESVVATGLPKEFSDLHYGVLSFGFNDRLIRVTAVGEGAEQDRTAARVTARYQELAELLAEKYERVRSDTHIDENYDGERKALGFFAKKNSMYSEFSGRDLRIELSVFAEANRTHWRLIFEYLPAMRALDERRRRLDENAL